MKTLFDKIWDAHVVTQVEGGPSQLYIDRHFCHEVTSPQAFAGLRERGLKVFRPEKTTCSPDHNIPTINQHLPIEDPVSRKQVETLTENVTEFGLTLWGLGTPQEW
ncbi:MAG: aconitase family protein, partial [Rikenellaceae bacterium]